MCSLKNEVHLLMKNTMACCAGGLAFWAVGWAFCMGDGAYATAFNGEFSIEVSTKLRESCPIFCVR